MADSPDQAAETTDSGSTHDCLCPLGGLMDLLSRRYAMQLICVVGAIGPARYGDIEAVFSAVSSSTLSRRLEELVEADILARTQYAEIPPRVEYELTPTGEELSRRLEPLLAWIDETDVAVDQS
ncbi:MAG: helix-turn-helix domain-containing protein [Natrialbaceae archaeon]|nr:helix-turn-helix domain-containing protein [Natrialbaceae archaeon]